MDIKDIQETVTAVGAGAGVIALVWNGLKEFSARRNRSASLIQPTLKLQGLGDLLTVDYHGAEGHTGYQVTVSCRSPRLLQGQSSKKGPGGSTEILGELQAQPFSQPMTKVREEPGIVRARFRIRGSPARKPIRLTFVVAEGYGARVVARRTLDMSGT